MGTDGDEGWRQVDEGWGHAAVDAATLHEPGNTREYVAMHHHLRVGPGDRLLDVACGAGLSVELAGLRGADCAGIDASPRLLAIARDRSPAADLRVGDMRRLPFDDASFDVVTSFRGIWGTTPDALDEVFRVLRPGGRTGVTCYGDLRACSGGWVLSSLRLATPSQREHNTAMVSLGAPGVGEEVLTAHGFVDVHRIAMPFVWEFADPEHYARSLAATGPAFEAVQASGREAFQELAVAAATQRVREGLPLRAEVDVVGLVGTRPGAAGEGWDG